MKNVNGFWLPDEEEHLVEMLAGEPIFEGLPTTECWKVHPIYYAYEVSTLGRVRRIARARGAKVGRTLKPRLGSNKYLNVSLSIDGLVKTKLVHVLVLETFVGLAPAGCEACHKDNNKINCTASNLHWGTHSSNYWDRVRAGGGNQGSRHGLAKLSEEDVRRIRRSPLPRKQLARMYGVCTQSIDSIVTRKRWRHVL